MKDIPGSLGLGRLMAPSRIGVLCAALVLLSLLPYPAFAQPAASPSPAKGAEGETTYVFERMWPTLQQPWYFLYPTGVAVDGNGNVYVVDGQSARIQKFDGNRALLAQWGSYGFGPGQFRSPSGVAVDGSGHVYVADSVNYRIQKFDGDGTFLAQWGSEGTDNGRFSVPSGVAVDGSGNIYVADKGNHRVQKFDDDGAFLAQWGGEGSGPGQFWYPEGVAVDGSGNVYVADTFNSSIKKFDGDGAFLAQWGSEGTGAGQLHLPSGVAVDGSGNVYVADTSNSSIKKFDGDGTFLAQWGSSGSGPGQFQSQEGVAVDVSGHVYVSDSGNRRIQTFDNDGTFLAQWRSYGSGSGQFHYPSAVAMDGSGNAYVADTHNNRIQKFGGDGAYMAQWGGEGSGPGQFVFPSGVAVDGSGNVYVADAGNDRIQKFHGGGVFLAQWGSYGSGPGQFIAPHGVAVDGSGNIYVTDWFNNRVQKFDGDGAFLAQWGSEGSGPGQFRYPEGVAVDSSGNVYVADNNNHRIQSFDGDGTFLAQWGSYGSAPGKFGYPVGLAVDGSGYVYVADANRIQKFDGKGSYLTQWGSFGSDPGQLTTPLGLAVDGSGYAYVADTYGHRIQKFRPVASAPGQKAIVVAAGGPFAGNTLWEATQFCANFAYRALTYRGFTKDTIQYLTTAPELDLDGNGLFDDVDGPTTLAALQEAITVWAANAEELVIYLVDHGGSDSFRMNGVETLEANILETWIGTAESSIPGTITVIYEACQSGSFLDELGAPNRIVISSSSPDESAHFISTGTISFSNFFWTEVFNGATVGDSFDVARDAIAGTVALQTPQLDDNGNGIGNEGSDGFVAAEFYLGSDVEFIGEAPVLNEVSPPQPLDGVASADLYALPYDPDGISRCWAVIRPPGFAPLSPTNPVLNLPILEMFPTDGLKTRWEGTYNGFTSLGIYQIAIYCKDAIGNTSLPKLTSLEVTSPLARRAILIAGESAVKANPAALTKAVTTARTALTGQGYGANDVRVYGPELLGNVTGPATLATVQEAITGWSGAETQDVVVYYVGDADTQGLRLGSQTLSPAQLDTWLDAAQAAMPGAVTVIVDADAPATLISALTAPAGKKRIVLSSTDNAAASLVNGVVSFSNYFWVRVLNGTNVDRAYRHAAQAMRFVSGQKGQIDDNGNGMANEAADGIVARSHTIGAGVLLAGDDPVIASLDPGTELGDATTALIGIENVTTTGEIAEVVALVSLRNAVKGTPSHAELQLEPVGDDRYEAEYDGFAVGGVYDVSVVAIDAQGNVSTPATTTYTKDAIADPDGNGVYNAVDIQLVINAALGLNSSADTDLNNDDATDAVDIQLIINAALGVL